jgi:nuclear RNA export factor
MKGKGSRVRSGASDRGGIRKRGSTRIDRDGDLSMDGGAARGRGKRARGDTGRATPAGGRPQARDRTDRTLNAIQKAIASNADQANIRQGTRGAGLEQVSVRGWKQSKAASNRDGGLESLIAFLEKKLTAPDSKAGARARITKVCATPELAVTDSKNAKRSYSPVCSRLLQAWYFRTTIGNV